MTYMYIRETASTRPLREQIKYADEHDILWTHRLGQGQYARENCTDICQLIEHPLVAGDRLIIQNLLLIGHTHQRIYDTLTTFHRARIQLEVVDISYTDLVPAVGDPRSSNDDYSRLTAFLRVFVVENRRRNGMRTSASAKSAGRGRPRKDWESLPGKVQGIIAYHVGHLYEYPESRALMDIQNAGYRLGISTFRALKKHYKTVILPKTGK